MREVALRDLTRLRKAQIDERTRAIQRLEKALQEAGIKPTSFASGTYSVGAGDAEGAACRHERCDRAGRARPWADAGERSRSWGGACQPFRYRPPRRPSRRAARTHRPLDAAVAKLDERIAAAYAPFAELVELVCTNPASPDPRPRC